MSNELVGIIIGSGRVASELSGRVTITIPAVGIGGLCRPFGIGSSVVAVVIL